MYGVRRASRGGSSRKLDGKEKTGGNIHPWVGIGAGVDLQKVGEMHVFCLVEPTVLSGSSKTTSQVYPAAAVPNNEVRTRDEAM